MSTFAKKSYTLYGDEDVVDRYEWYFVAFYTAIFAFSWNTGVDSFAYALRFMNGCEFEEDNKEYLYNYLTNFIAHSPIPYWVGMAVLGFGQIYPLVKALRRDREILVALPFVLFGNCYFLTYMNGMRQMVAASIFVYACVYIHERKLWKYCIAIFVGSLFHHSALMLLPIYLLAYADKLLAKINSKRIILLCVFIVCVILGFTPSFQSVISYIETLSEVAGYTNYTDRVGEFLSGDYTEEAHNFGLMMMSYFLVGCFIIWYGPMLKENYEERIPLFNLWYFLAVAYACSFFLIVNISHIFIRPVMYLLPFQLIIASLLLWKLYEDKTLRNAAIAFTAVIWMECGWNLYKNQEPWNSTNYHLSWFYDLSKYHRK